MEVEDTHTYYVGSQSVLVHNDCKGKGQTGKESTNKKDAKNPKGENENKNITKVDDKYLKKKKVDAHQVKKDYLDDKAPIAQYDLYIDKSSGRLFIFRKGGKGIGIPTDIFIK